MRKKKFYDKPRQIIITISVRDRWVYDLIDKTVELKKDMGWETSHSYEVVRLLKLQLLGLASTPEVELMRQILKGGVEESMEELI